MFTTSGNKGNNKITELRTILQRESQNSQLYKQTKSVNNRKTVKTVIWIRGHYPRILFRLDMRLDYHPAHRRNDVELKTLNNMLIILFF